MGSFENLFKNEPALVTTFLNATATLLAAFAFTATQSQMAAITVIGTALVAIVTASLTRPIHVALLGGAVMSGLTAAAAFGLKLQPQDLALVATFLGAVGSLLVRTAPDVFALAHLSGRPNPAESLHR